MTASLWVVILGAILGAGGLGSLGTLLLVRPQRDKIAAEALKTKAEAADVITDQALALINPLHQEINRLASRLTATSEELDRAQKRVEELTRNLDEAHVRETTHLKRIQELEEENAAMRALRRQYEE